MVLWGALNVTFSNNYEVGPEAIFSDILFKFLYEQQERKLDEVGRQRGLEELVVGKIK